MSGSVMRAHFIPIRHFQLKLTSTAEGTQDTVSALHHRDEEIEAF